MHRLIGWLALTMALVAPAARAQILDAPPGLSDRLKPCTAAHVKLGALCIDTHASFIVVTGPLQTAYLEQDFARLDGLFAKWCTGDDRLPGGRWLLSFYSEAMKTQFQAWKRWDQDLETLQRWKKARPGSAAADYTEALYWSAYAWEARGTAYASSVSGDAWRLFHERLQRSQALLDGLRQADNPCAVVYSSSVSTMIDLGRPPNDIFAVFNEGVRHWPEFHGLYQSAARMFEPKWGGSVPAFEQFAEAAAEHTKSFEGMGMYARMFELVDSKTNIPFDDVKGHPPEWDKLHAGYEDLTHKYPSSLSLQLRYLDVACRSTDSALYRRLRTEVDGYQSLIQMSVPVDACDLKHKWKGASLQ